MLRSVSGAKEIQIVLGVAIADQIGENFTEHRYEFESPEQGLAIIAELQRGWRSIQKCPSGVLV